MKIHQCNFRRLSTQCCMATYDGVRQGHKNNDDIAGHLIAEMVVATLGLVQRGSTLFSMAGRSKDKNINDLSWRCDARYSGSSSGLSSWSAAKHGTML